MSSLGNKGNDVESPYVMINNAQMVPTSEAQGSDARSSTDTQERTFKRFPMTVEACTHCNKKVTTSINTRMAMQTWIAVLILAICFWPLFWVPLVVASAKKTEHFCPQCDAKLGEVAPFSDCCAK